MNICNPTRFKKTTFIGGKKIPPLAEKKIVGCEKTVPFELFHSCFLFPGRGFGRYCPDHAGEDVFRHSVEFPYDRPALQLSVPRQAVRDPLPSHRLHDRLPRPEQGVRSLTQPTQSPGTLLHCQL